MGRRKTEKFVVDAEYIDGGEMLEIYKRFENEKKSKNWYAHFKRYQRRESLKEPDKNLAIKKAFEREKFIGDALADGVLLKSVTFKKAFDQYLKERQKDGLSKKEFEKAEAAYQYFTTHIPERTLVTGVTRGMLRKIFDENPIAKSVRPKYEGHLSKMFRLAVDNEQMREKSIPSIPREKYKAGRQGTITDEEYKALVLKLHLNAIDFYAANGKKISRRNFYYRWYAWAFVQVMALTGMRQREIINTKWDYITHKTLNKEYLNRQQYLKYEPENPVNQKTILISYDTDQIVNLKATREKTIIGIKIFEEYAKTRRPRTTIAFQGLADVLDLWGLIQELAFSNRDKPEYVFANYDGELIREGEPGFRQTLIEKAMQEVVKRKNENGRAVDADGRTVATYSLRHWHMTKRISNGDSDAKIARLCGTGEKMIRNHYEHETTLRDARFDDEIDKLLAS